MIRSAVNNTVLFGSLIGGAAVTGLLAPMLISSRGGFGPGVLQAASLPRGAVAVLGSVVVGTALAILVGRVINAAVGMFVMGGALFGLAWRVGRAREIIDSGATPLVIETLAWALVILAATRVVFAATGGLHDVEPKPDGSRPHWLLSRDALMHLLAGLFALPAIWLVAQSGLKGQVLGASICGGIAAGMTGRLVAPHVQPIVLFAAPVLWGALGQIIGRARAGDLANSLMSGNLPALCLPMPVELAVGSLIGVAIGLGWAKSFLHHEEE